LAKRATFLLEDTILEGLTHQTGKRSVNETRYLSPHIRFVDKQGGGAYAWQYFSPSFLGLRTQEAQQFLSLGMAGMILGGGLAIGGTIRMISLWVSFKLQAVYPGQQFRYETESFIKARVVITGMGTLIPSIK